MMVDIHAVDSDFEEPDSDAPPKKKPAAKPKKAPAKAAAKKAPAKGRGKKAAVVVSSFCILVTVHLLIWTSI
jgi:double-strand break repair protein MRE11